ncbi:MAG: PEP-CTERM sorting domain-containing protein [Candidatus Acidiferrales bacterium]
MTTRNRWVVIAFALLIAAGLSASFAPTASADSSATYDLTGVTFVGGGTATGSFTFDFTTGQFTALNISTQGTVGTGSQTFSLTNFVPGAFSFDTGYSTTPPEFALSNGTDFLWLDLFVAAGPNGTFTLVTDPDNTGNFSDLAYSCSYSVTLGDGCDFADGVSGGSLKGVSAVATTPEPSSGALMLTAVLGLILFAGLRRKDLLVN